MVMSSAARNRLSIVPRRMNTIRALFSPPPEERAVATSSLVVVGGGVVSRGVVKLSYSWIMEPEAPGRCYAADWGKSKVTRTGAMIQA